jgi:hypothetical protein
LNSLEEVMDTNPYVFEHRLAEYQKLRLAEAAQRRLVRSLKAAAENRPAWCPLALALAAALITLGRRLQAAAEPQPQPACETC